MWKFIILIVAAFVLYKMFTTEQKRKTKASQKETDRLKATGELVRDPQCGAYVSVDSDIRVREGDVVHRFCSYECRDKYLNELDSQSTKHLNADDSQDKGETS